MSDKPSSNEEEYFARQEADKIERIREAVEGSTAALDPAERERLKELHWMHCPKCGMGLSEIEFRGVQVDACFTCGGTYFDKGEVEKILEYKDPGVLGKMFVALFGGKR